MDVSDKKVRVIGAGLAGCEAALQLAARGFAVDLHEMKPQKRTPAQVSDDFCELVCSNSFRSNNPMNAVGLLKEEMRRAGGFLIACADEAKVPAGDALAVDRELFARLVCSKLRDFPNITIVPGEVEKIPTDGATTVVATGPLTSDGLAAHIVEVIGQEGLAFYDAIAPIVEADSVDMEHAYFASRYGKGEGSDYLNCPMNADEYDVFLKALLQSDQAHAKEFENLHYFEGCLPIEELASRGPMTLLFGPFKPVGLEDPRTGRRPHAVLQLRKENVHGTAYNFVGCQTRLKQPAQKEVFGLIPALKNARYLRYGAIHRNTYLDAPRVLGDCMQLKAGGYEHVHFAGQITGVEGYVESMACGLVVARLIAESAERRPTTPPPETTVLGGLYRHTRGMLQADPKLSYVPSNVTWAMVPPIADRRKSKSEERAAMVERALIDIAKWKIGDIQ